ncbi:MAG: efflux RND transporter periplasmic adaptor subunit [Bacteroidaceae bacterium]|nr:efflux RND transporter periplasmic adaptor subunit [Bacteroidaceae bacterium]
MIRKIAWALLTALLLLTSCQEKKQEKAALVYKTMKVERTSQAVKVGYSATMKGREIVEIRPQVSGLITKILTSEGQKVQKGQTLFIIDQVPYVAALNTAESALKSAKAAEATAQLAYDSKKELRQQQVISDYDLKTAQQALVSAQAQVAQAQAQVANARNSLSYTVVKSPVSGVAGMIPYHVGALVSSNIAEPLISVCDDSEMWVYFSLSEREVTDLTLQYGSLEKFMQGMPDVTLLLSNGKEYGQKGRVNAVSGIVDASTGAVSLRAVFPNEDHLLRNGGTGTIVISTIKNQVIVIPQTATFELQNKVFVYRVVDGKTAQTEIKVAPLDDGTSYIVEEGLSEGDVIIAEGAGLLKEGVEVKAPSPLPLWGSTSKGKPNDGKGKNSPQKSNSGIGNNTPPKGEQGGGL